MHPASRTSHRLLLGLVLVLALGLRVANLVDISDSPFFTRPVIDGRAYDNWAQAITNGKAPATPFYQDPLYPYFLAAIYAVFGHSYVAVYIAQLVLALVLLLLVFDTARLLFDWRAGILAAGIAALYKPFIFYESQIEKTALAVFLTALFLWLFVRATSLKPQTSSRESGMRSAFWALGCGVALGLAALTRANTLLFTLLLPVVLLLSRQSPAASRQSRLVAALLGVLGVLVVIFPVCLRNSILAHEFTLTTTQAGQNLYIGNSPYNTTGQYQAPPWIRPNPDFEQPDFAEYANKTAGKVLSYSGVSRFYTSAALRWATTHGRDFANLLWRKIVLYFNNFEVPDNQDYYFFSRYSWVLRLPLLSFGIVFALGLAAMILLARGLARLSLVVFFFGYAASVVVFFVFSRYRIPALPALLPFAGAMLPWLADQARNRSSFVVLSESRNRSSPPRHKDTKTGPDRGAVRTLGALGGSSPASGFRARLVGGLALIAAAFALTIYPVHHGSGKTEAAQCLTNLASIYYHEGDTAKGIATYEEALKTCPRHAEASRNLGIIMLGRGNTERAQELLSDAAHAEPGNPTTHVYLGRLYERQGRLGEAYLEFRKAVGLAPGRVEFRFELATALQQLDNYGPALAQYDTMIQLAPDNPVVRHNYAVALYNVGRLRDARIQLEQARRLGGPVNPKFDSLLRTGRRPDR